MEFIALAGHLNLRRPRTETNNVILSLSLSSRFNPNREKTLHIKFVATVPQETASRRRGSGVGLLHTEQRLSTTLDANVS